jgi:hypothetical protein
MRTIPRVTDVAVSAVGLFEGEFNAGNSIAPGFFEVLRIRLLRGRDFNNRDRADSQLVAIVSASLARPNEQRLRDAYKAVPPKVCASNRSSNARNSAARCAPMRCAAFVIKRRGISVQEFVKLFQRRRKRGRLFRR